MSLVCIVPGPDKEYARHPIGDKWCFRCRKRLPHDDVLWGDSEPSYYEPIWVTECSRCGGDYTTFPSTQI